MKTNTLPLEDHPIAAVFPLLGSDELQALADDIKASGLRHKIILHEGKILDGRNRYRAARQASVEPTFEQYTGSDPVGFVVSLNIHRRNLTASQRAMIAAELANMKVGKPRAGGNSANLQNKVSQTEAAAKLNVSPRAVADATTVKKHGTPELQDAVRGGKASVSAAAVVAKLPAKDQRAAVDAGRVGVASAAKGGTAPLSKQAQAHNARNELFKKVSPETKQAIENNVIRIKDEEVIELATKPVEIVDQAVNLMHANGWPLKRALRSIERPIDKDSSVDDLIHLCIGAGGKWSGLFVLDAFRVTVEHLKPATGKA